MPAPSRDLTLVYLTAQRLPAAWLDWHRAHLDALGYPILQVGRRSGDLVDDVRTPAGYGNIYRQLWRAVQQIHTPYVAVVEDDVLYPPVHFTHRPSDLAYNLHRWALFTWGPAIYSWRNRVSNCSLIGPRDAIWRALEARRLAHPDWPDRGAGELGRPFVEGVLGLTPQPASVWWSPGAGLVQINHPLGTEDRQRRQRKALGPVQALDIPYWGPAAQHQERCRIMLTEMAA